MKKIFIILFIGFCYPALAQEEIPYHYETYQYDFGTHNGKQKIDPENPEVSFKEFSTIISIPGAAWLQVYFEKVTLGENSYVLITSLEDGSTQRLNAKHMRIWKNSSAYFNGDKLKVSLYVAPEEQKIQLSIYEIMAGEHVSDKSNETPIQEAQCGSQDNRVASNHPAIGRIVPGGCTGWIISNGAFLTAGHCADNAATINILEFNVPASDPNGTINHPPAEDQYPVLDETIVFEDANVANDSGNDWAIFDCGVNANTDMTAAEAQGAFFRMTRDFTPATVRITGYGTDDTPLGTSGWRNADNQTQQTHSGPLNSEIVNNANAISYNYTVDTEGGNSGSPIIWEGAANNTAIGIHTNAGCNTGNNPGGNHGTSFEANDLENAIQTFLGNNVEYVDADHPVGVALTNGSIFRPFRTVQEALNNAAPGALVSIVEGAYSESLVITGELSIRASVGTVIIGPNAVMARSADYDDYGTDKLPVKVDGEIETEKDNFPTVSPNPFTHTTTFTYIVEQENSPVLLNIYNIAGEKITTLVQEERLTAGTYHAEFDGSGLPAGMYLYRLEIGKTVKTGKIIVKK